MSSEAPETASRFEFAWERRYRIAALAFGITPSTAWVEVDSSHLYVRYGVWKLQSALTNITGVERSGSYGFVKTAGPPHLSFSDRGVSFTTNSHEGLCVSFRNPVSGIDPTGLIKHPGATITVADVAGFADALGFPHDARS